MNKELEDKKQSEVEITDENRMFEELLNKRALKIGRKVLDEICLHNEEIKVNIRKSEFFDWFVIDIGVHSVTGLIDKEIEFIKKGGLRERSLNDFEIKETEE